MPGRGASLTTPAAVKAGLDGTRAFVTRDVRRREAGAREGKDLRTVYKDTYALLKPSSATG